MSNLGPPPGADRAPHPEQTSSSDLAGRVAERSGLTRYKDKRNVERLVRAFLEELREAIVAGEDVSLYGLARIVRGDIAGLENTLVQFHPGERLRAALKGKKPRWKRSKRA